jgi:transcriptional regulator with GAF, ATPase, and Fis domain
MELFELLEWLLPAGTLSGAQSGSGSDSGMEPIAGINSEEDLFTFIQAVLQPYLHAFTLLIGIAGPDGAIAQWWLHEEDVTLIGKLPVKVRESYLSDDVSGVHELDAPDRRDALKTQLYNSGAAEMFLLPLNNSFRNIGFLALAAKQTSRFSLPLQLKLAECKNQISAACLRLLLVNVLDRPVNIEDDNKLSDKLVGGAALRPLIEQVRMVAPTDATVLLTGETGTGKEVFAETVHNFSNRKDKLMVKINCAALPPQLIESELFGHEKGAFTGALHKRIGKFELADGGTLFLDEVGELSLDLQVKLLRVLQEKEIERLGGDKTIKVDVRIIAATNRILEDEVKAGRFRQDLYYRLFVFPLHLPPLRERKEDIPVLLQYFVNKAAKQYGRPAKNISAGSLEMLRNYTWPGNIREMEHMVERAVISSFSPTITITPPVHQQVVSSDTSPPTILSLADAEREAIIRALKYCNGRIRGPQGAAEILDIKATTLEARMKKLGIVKEHIIQ